MGDYETDTDERPRKSKKKKARHADAAIIEKVTNLVALATENENEDEARNSALAAVRLMAKHGLAVIPSDEVERLRKYIEGTQALQKEAKEQQVQNMLIGGVVGMFLAKAKLLG